MAATMIAKGRPKSTAISLLGLVVGGSAASLFARAGWGVGVLWAWVGLCFFDFAFLDMVHLLNLTDFGFGESVRVGQAVGGRSMRRR